MSASSPFILAAKTDMGRVRTNNEDNCLARPDLGLFVVCDGMGGHAAGEVASRMTCEVLAEEIEKAQATRVKLAETGSAADARALQKVLEKAIQKATKAIFKKADGNADLEGMGTTCVALVLAGHKAVYGHVGDSRLFMLRQNTVHQLTEDHTFVKELVKSGVLTKEEAAHHPQGNVLSRAVGVQPSVAVDTLVFDVDAGDTLLLCTDGLHNYFPQPEEMLSFVGEDLTAALDKLISTALARGGHDNCTGILLRLAAEEEGHVAASDRIAILKKIPLFTYLSYAELVKVLGITQLQRVPAGVTFVTEGEKGDELYVLLSGEVDIVKAGTTITQLKAGVHIGEMALVDNAPRSASVRAIGDINVLAMKRSDFFWLIRHEPVIASKLLWSFVQVLSNRLRDTNEALRGARSQLKEQDQGEIEVLFEDADDARSGEADGERTPLDGTDVNAIQDEE